MNVAGNNKIKKSRFNRDFLLKFIIIAVPISVANVGCVQSAGDVVIFSANEEAEKNEIKIAKQIVPICFMLGNKLHMCVGFCGFQPIQPFLHNTF